MPNYEWIEFGEVFTLEKGKIQSSEVEEDVEGEGVFINTSKFGDFKKITNCNLDGENIFITTFMPKGKTEDESYIVMQYYNGKCNYSNLLSRIMTNNKYKKKINLKFIYYYLKSIKTHIEKYYQKGACNKSLDIKNFNRMKIPIPTLESQSNIITRLDSSNKKLVYARKIVELMKLDIVNFYEWDIEIANGKKDTEWVEFGEVFTLEKGKLQSSKVEEDEEVEEVEDELNDKILFITKAEINEKSKKIMSDNYYNGGIFMAQAFNGNGKCPIRYTDEKCIHSNLMYYLNLNKKYKNKIHIKYVYYYLMHIKEHIEKTYNKGACNQCLDIKNFNRMKIQIPSMEFQNYSMGVITNIEETIKRWNVDIENIEKDGEKKFLTYLEMEYVKLNKQVK
jgi:restriction endonuclease S subunit